MKEATGRNVQEPCGRAAVELDLEKQAAGGLLVSVLEGDKQAYEAVSPDMC